MRILFLLLLLAMHGLARPDAATNPHTFPNPPTFPNGFIVGDVSATQANIWTRATPTPAINELPANPGHSPQLRVVYQGHDGAQSGASPWTSVSAQTDYTADIKLRRLRPATTYAITLEARLVPHDRVTRLSGSFRTAPLPFRETPVRFAVIAGEHGFIARDQGGLKAHHSIHQQRYDFLVHAGRSIDYETAHAPVTDLATARAVWHQARGLPNFQALHRETPSYWLRDDLDTCGTRATPGQEKRFGLFQFQDGIALFNEQTPGNGNYHTVSHGQLAQIWFLDCRQHREIRHGVLLGHEQKAWLEKTLHASQAKVRIIICPTPVLGPVRQDNRDSHAAGYHHEGTWLRQLLTKRNAIILTGNRPWQYASVDRERSIWEFGCGPAAPERTRLPPQTQHQYSQFCEQAAGFLDIAITNHQGSPQCLVRLLSPEGKLNFKQTIYFDGGQ